MTALLTSGWVRLAITISGVPSAVQCDHFVVPAQGPRQLAGSGPTPDERLEPDTVIPGSATIPPDKVTAVQIVDHTTGAVLVSLTA